MAHPYLPVSWKEYHTRSLKLAAAILSAGNHHDEIVAIARGGLTLGLILTDFLRHPLSTITTKSYQDLQRQGDITITLPLSASYKGKRILLVDDVSDSGKIFTHVLQYLKEHEHPSEITTAALFYKPQATYCPDYYAKKTSKWILFPHEVTESIASISTSQQEKGKSKAEIQTFLLSLGYTMGQIAFTRKHYLT